MFSEIDFCFESHFRFGFSVTAKISNEITKKKKSFSRPPLKETSFLSCVRKQSDSHDLSSLTYSRLQKLLKHISIRRLKTDNDEGRPLVKLPPRTVVIQEVELSDKERKLYDSMQNHGQLIIRR